MSCMLRIFLKAHEQFLRNCLQAVLWINGRPVAKCDPLHSRATQHDRLSLPMGNPTLDKWEHD